jgi:hypothetical protein
MEINQPKCGKPQTRGRKLRSGVNWQVALRRRNKNGGKTRLWCIHMFSMKVNCLSSNDLKSCAGCSVATGRASQDGQVKNEVPNKERYPGPPGTGLSNELTSQSRKKNILLWNNKINKQQNECWRLQIGTKIYEKGNEYMESQVETDLYIMAITKQTCKSQRPSTMEEDWIGSQGPERTVALEEEEKEEEKRRRRRIRRKSF